MAFQLFISYAHNDNVPPIEGDGKGFVSTLVKYLEHYFTILGMPRPIVWRDKGVLRPSDQFDGIIQQGLADSDVLLVIYSNNWLHSEYCKKELTLFREQRPKLSVDQVRSRIICLEKHFLPVETRPELLGGQEAYRFYEPDEEFRGRYVEFFELGAKEQSKKFARTTRDLAEDLWTRAKAHEEVPIVPNGQRPPAVARLTQRTVYLAKPAKDLRWAYERLYDELTGNDFNVVPARDEKIPSDDPAAAAAFIQNALAQSERSIHVVGEKGGPVIDEEDAGLALQLRLARERIGQDASFRRIVWAPEILRDDNAAVLRDGRDPIATLKRFDELCEKDKVDSAELSTFVEFLIQHLFISKPQLTIPDRTVLGDGSHVYILADEQDADYAMEVADSLRQRNVGFALPIWSDEKAQCEEHEREQLAQCDAVIIPWANKGTSWVRSISENFADWRKHGRDREFAVRSVVEGWPPNADKKAFKRFPPREAIDVVLDLTDCTEPPLPPEKFGPLFKESSS